MPGALTLVVTDPVTPAMEPVGLAEVKDWCRIDTGDNDATIASMIVAARQHLGDLAGYSGLVFITQTYDWTLDAFPACPALAFPVWPIQSVTSVSYVDTAGDAQTWAGASYLVDTKSMPARLTPAYGEVWPSTRAQMNAVTIRFIAGYGDDPADVPEPLRTAIKALVAHWHEHREPVLTGTIQAELPMHVKALVNPYRLHMGVG